METTEAFILGGQLIVAAGQLAVLAWQAKLLNKTLAATRTAAEATRVSADAAKKSADIAEKSVNNIERPYLLVESVVPHIRDHMGNSTPTSVPPYVVFSLKNFGRSPSLLLEVRMAMEAMQSDLRNQNPPLLTGVPLGNVIVIGPRELKEFTCRYSNSVGDGVRAQMEREEFHFWLYVLARYEDMLGAEHQIQMRYKYDVRADAFSCMHMDDYTIRT